MQRTCCGRFELSGPEDARQTRMVKYWFAASHTCFLNTQNWQYHETETDDDDGSGSEDDASLAKIKTAVSTITEFFEDH